MKMKKGMMRMMAILLAAIIVVMPFSTAQVFDIGKTIEEAEVGEAIVVNIKGYEPEILPASLIEDGDIPVYAFLTGVTPARLLGAESKIEPLYGQPLVKQVLVRPLDDETMEAVWGTPKHVQPEQYSLDDLGYLVIMLKQIEKEKEVPDAINLKMRAEVIFEDIERLYSLIQQDLVLPEEPDEQAWKTKYLDDYSFFSKRGFIRAREITSTSAKLTVYASTDTIWPFTGAPRPLKDISLTKGQVSDYIRLSEMQALTNAFRVKLVDIIDPTQKRARLRVNIAGQEQERIVTVGSQLYPSSELKVVAINAYKEAGATTRYEVLIRGPRDSKTITKKFFAESQKEEKKNETDPCLGSVVLFSATEPAAILLEKAKQATNEQVYCTAITEYKKISEQYFGVMDEAGVLYTDKSNFRIAQIYDLLGYSNNAQEYYKKAVVNNKGEFIPEAQARITELEKDAQYGATFVMGEFEEFNKPVRVKLLDVLGTDEEQAFATFDVQQEGTKKIIVGGKIFSADIKEGNSVFNWIIDKIAPEYVTVSKKYVSGAPKDYKPETKILNIRQSGESLSGKVVYVKDISLKKFALVSIIPGTGLPLISVSNFTLHIPIEKRAITLTPSQISSQINSTEELIKKLDSVIGKLDTVVTTWNKACLFTFAYVTLKNLFFSGLARTTARRFAMHGTDGKSGWDVYCKTNSGKGKLYSRYDACIEANVDNIEDTIDDSQSAIERANDDMKDYKGEDWYLELAKNYPELTIYQKYMGEDLYDVQMLRDYRYWQLMKESSSYSKLTGQPAAEAGYGYDFRKEIDAKKFDFEKASEDKLKAYKSTIDQIKNSYPNFEKLDEENKQQLFSDLYNSNRLSDLKYTSVYPSLGTSYVPLQPLNIRMDVKTKEFKAYTAAGEKKLKEATVKDYLTQLEAIAEKKTGTEKDKLNTELLELTKKYQNNTLAPLQTDRGQVYMDDAKKLYVASSRAFSTGETRESYDKRATLEFYPDGKPYCLPTCFGGNYVKILDFYKDGSPQTLQEWNVGKDGLLCTEDDVLVKHQSVLERSGNEAEHNRLRSIASRMTARKPGESVSMCNQNFGVSNSRAQAEVARTQPNCYDTMDPSDCRLLFGVCDPVMCPPSRFNLGGTWQVDNVVQTGIIGSMVLGLHNFDLPYEPVPICITGVLAGMRNIKSILQGYAECLKTAQVQGRSVGICDKIRSIFICELVWKEALAIFNVRGGIMSWIADKLFDQTKGGGEYLTFQSHLQNVADSVSFFTKTYARTAFAAFDARSTEEIGETICKQAVYGKLPDVGALLDQLAEPESPPQYTALLTEFPYSEIRRQSRYQTFYHIYAGEDREATYSVYLENSATRDSFYVTERCLGKNGIIAKGGIASFTIDCIAPKGFDRVCISVNGAVNCGFGKVSSAFGINYLNDLIVEDETKRDIKSEEECYPSASTTSPSLGSIPLPGKIDLLTTGIVRVCSLLNPGMGTNPNDWRIVGDCGKDSTGRSLGSCWIDLRTVSIKDTERMENVMAALDEQGFMQKKLEMGITDLLDANASIAELTRIKRLEKKTCEDFSNSLVAYKDLVWRTIVPKVAAEAQLSTGNMLEKLASECARISEKLEIRKLKLEFEKSLETIYLKYFGKPDQQSQYASEIDSAYENIKKELDALAKKLDADLTVYRSEDFAPVYLAYRAKSLKTAESFEELPEVESKCGQCGSGTLEACDLEECHKLGDCFFKKSTGVTGWVKSIGSSITDKSYGECLACETAKSCADFNSDPAKCDARQCTNLAELDCDFSTSSVQCIAKGPSPEGSKQVITDYGVIWVYPNEQCGVHNNCVYMEDKSILRGENEGKYLVLHITQGGSAEQTHNLLATEREHLSVQYILARDGHIIQQVTEDKIAQHAGVPGERWNTEGIGIEIANSGPDCGVVCGENRLQQFSNVKCVPTDCILPPNPAKYDVMKWEKFDDEQMAALVKLSAEIMIRHKIPMSNIRAHGIKGREGSCAVPGISNLKSDPGPLFDWCKFLENLNKAIAAYSPDLAEKAVSPELAEAKQDLAFFGCEEPTTETISNYLTNLINGRVSSGKSYKDAIAEETANNPEDAPLLAAIIAVETGFGRGTAAAIPARYSHYKFKLTLVENCVSSQGKNMEYKEIVKLALSAYGTSECVACAALRNTATARPDFREISAEINEPIIRACLCTRDKCPEELDELVERQSLIEDKRGQVAEIMFLKEVFSEEF